MGIVFCSCRSVSLIIFLLFLAYPIFAPAAQAKISGMSKTGQPSLPRYGHSQVWTGKDLIVWGGAQNEGAKRRLLSSGATYRESKDRWSLLPRDGAPSARFGHTAVWTGKEMIVWGGMTQAGRAIRSGARYDPARKRWSPVSLNGAPSARAGHTAVWTGKEMIVWGGQYKDDGAAYDPVRDKWRAISSVGAPAPRVGHGAVWTGRYMVVWGGSERGAFKLHGTGGMYDVVRDKWAPMTKKNAPWGGDGHDIVEGERAVELIWTGSRLIALPVSPGGRPFSMWHAGGIFNLKTNRWSTLSSVGAPDVRLYGALWTGRRLVALGSMVNKLVVSERSLASNIWRPMFSASTGSFQGRQFTWSSQSGQILVFGGRWADGQNEFSGGLKGKRGFCIKPR